MKKVRNFTQGWSRDLIRLYLEENLRALFDKASAPHILLCQVRDKNLNA